MCGLLFAQSLSSFVGETAPPTQQGATLHLVPYGGLAPSATPLLWNAAPLNMAIRYVSPAKRLTALQVQRTRLAMSSSIWLITAQIVPVVRRRAYFWCCKRDLNPHAPGYEPGALPEELLQQDIRRWVIKPANTFWKETNKGSMKFFWNFHHNNFNM